MNPIRTIALLATLSVVLTACSTDSGDEDTTPPPDNPTPPPQDNPTTTVNDAFGRDPDFFGFYRSMQAYEEGLKAKDTRLLLSPNTEFFRYFNDPAGAQGSKTPAQ